MKDLPELPKPGYDHLEINDLGDYTLGYELKVIHDARTRHPNYFAAVIDALEISTNRMAEYAGDDTLDPFFNFKWRASIMKDPGDEISMREVLLVFRGDIFLKLSRLVSNFKDMSIPRLEDTLLDLGNYALLALGYIYSTKGKKK